jgi:hypothetical protein
MTGKQLWYVQTKKIGRSVTQAASETLDLFEFPNNSSMELHRYRQSIIHTQTIHCFRPECRHFPALLIGKCEQRVFGCAKSSVSAFDGAERSEGCKGAQANLCARRKSGTAALKCEFMRFATDFGRLTEEVATLNSAEAANAGTLREGLASENTQFAEIA